MGRLLHIMLKFAVLAICAATVLSEYSDGGLCLNSGEVAYLCTAGSPVADKVASALAACAEQTEPAGRSLNRRRGKGKGKGKKCPTMDEIFEDIEEEFGDDACVYDAMGWLDEEGNVNNETITMDVMSLPEEVSAMITHEGVAECTENMINYIGEDPTFKRCSNKYSEEELDMLSQVGHLIAGFKCFQDSFNEACNSYLKDQMFGQVTQPQPAGRTFGCFQTCQAANFASTTSCTFGLFFKRTKPCNLLFPALAGIASG